MAEPISEACRLSQGQSFIANECVARRYITRMNRVSDIFCDMGRRLREARSSLYRYCDPASSSSEESSSSSSSWDCPVIDAEPEIPSLTFLISPNDLGQDEWDALSSLEEEVCLTLKKIILFESTAKRPCSSSSSSSSSSSGESSSSSSSSSSSYSSSSSSNVDSESSSSSETPPSSSSSSAEPECLTGLAFVSLCPTYPNYILVPIPTTVGSGQCKYAGYGPPASSSSSSSSSGEVDPEIILRYNLTNHEWQVEAFVGGAILASFAMGSEFDPRGAYTWEIAPCTDEPVYVL